MTAEFWDFDFKSSVYDISAFAEKITEKTGRDKVNLIGFEMGSSPIFYGLSTTDELDIPWKEKINKFVALSPCLLPTIPSKIMTSTTELNEAGE